MGMGNAEFFAYDSESVIRPSAARDALDLVADKWTPLVIYLLAGGRQRYSQLKRRLGGISQKMLTQTLRKLEAAECVTRTVQPTVPVTVEYELTPLGRTLVEPLVGLMRWAHDHAGECGFVDEPAADVAGIAAVRA